MDIEIRSERPEDFEAILKLTYESFLTLDYDGRKRIDEHYLVQLFKGSSSVINDLSFVAVVDGEIVGHILYIESKVVQGIAIGDEKKNQDVHDISSADIKTITFGPLTVHPKYHRQGIGSALVFHSIEVAKDLGYGAVIIVGVSDYYPKLGFKRSWELGLKLEDGTSPDVLMAIEITEGYLNGGGEVHFLAPEYEKCEAEDEDFEDFYKQFMKKYYPNQITLRPFWDNDISLMEIWLYLPHVAEWYEHPEHWLSEVKKRKEEFSFLTHFIVEFEGKPIGFAQYYDCYFAKEHEIWHDEWNVNEKQGIDYSIDYLIGDTEYLHKGYGKEIVRQLVERIKALGAKRIIAEPEEENSNSNGVLISNGFIAFAEGYVKEL